MLALPDVSRHERTSVFTWGSGTYMWAAYCTIRYTSYRKHKYQLYYVAMNALSYLLLDMKIA
jgi:hypothetical protein